MTAIRPLSALLLLAGCGGLSAPIADPDCDPATDPTCVPTPTGPGTGGPGPGTGSATGTGSGTGGLPGGEICDDGTDNDEDGDTDCEDSECAADPGCDADGDGYADVDLGGDDCDDADGGINPGAIEICDTFDNNCNDSIDEDGDGDGSDVCSDCDDLDAGVYPGAYDPCGDGIDADCNGSDSCSDWAEGFEAGNLGALVGSGTLSMVAGTSNPYTGTRSAEAPAALNDSQTSCMSVVLNFATSGEIRFWRSVDSESGYDYLRFYIDNVQQSQNAGIIPWAEEVYAVASGSHTMRWCYEKDGSVSHGADTAWVDDIVTVGGVP